MPTYSVVYQLAPLPLQDDHWDEMLDREGLVAATEAVAALTQKLYDLGGPWTVPDISATNKSAAFDSGKSVVEGALGKSVAGAPSQTYWVPSGAQHLIFSLVLDGNSAWQPSFSVNVGGDAYDLTCLVVVCGEVTG